VTRHSEFVPLSDKAAPLSSELLTPDEVADLFKVSKRTVFRMRAAGLLPPPLELTTNLIRWRASDIQRFIGELRIRKARRRRRSRVVAPPDTV
jgi:predicted DNA-binding transcriptional regulator AlpA